MNVGIDVGYSAVKVVGGHDRLVTFPSVVGTPDRARFAVNGGAADRTGDIILDVPGDGTWLIGEGAMMQSRFVTRREDRGWIESDTYRRLMLAAFTELTAATAVDLVVVTGLPVAFYRKDKDALRDRFLGEHRVGRDSRRAQQVFRVAECRVIPQPFGALLAEALDNRGRVVNKAMVGNVGVIDIGGKTTNFLSVNRLAEIGHETDSANVGAWDVARAVRNHLTDTCPNLDLRDHEVVNAVVSRKVRYYGEAVDLTDVVDEALEPMAAEVVARATQLWNSGAGLDVILVTGGGALLLGPYLARAFPHVRVVQNPVFANAVGYWRFAQMIANGS